MAGSLPNEVSTLFALQRLELFANVINGTLPLGLSNITQLVLLDLEQNLLMGPAFPTSIFGLTSLVAYRVSNNALTGTIAPQVSALQILEQLWASQNLMTGSIPPQIAAASKMQSLFLY